MINDLTKGYVFGIPKLFVNVVLIGSMAYLIWSYFHKKGDEVDKMLPAFGEDEEKNPEMNTGQCAVCGCDDDKLKISFYLNENSPFSEIDRDLILCSQCIDQSYPRTKEVVEKIIEAKKETIKVMGFSEPIL